jgi:hypothetical protein
MSPEGDSAETLNILISPFLKLNKHNGKINCIPGSAT